MKSRTGSSYTCILLIDQSERKHLILAEKYYPEFIEVLGRPPFDVLFGLCKAYENVELIAATVRLFIFQKFPLGMALLTNFIER